MLVIIRLSKLKSASLLFELTNPAIPHIWTSLVRSDDGAYVSSRRKAGQGTNSVSQTSAVDCEQLKRRFQLAAYESAVVAQYGEHHVSLRA